MEATGFRRLSTEECPSLSWPFTAMYIGASSESSSSETKKCLGVYKTALWEPLSVFIEEYGVTPLSLANGRVKGGASGQRAGLWTRAEQLSSQACPVWTRCDQDSSRGGRFQHLASVL